jgi:hypothetical protein
MNVSPNFSPPISLMKPYFTLSSGFYLLSMLSLFFVDPFVDIKNFNLLAWVHLYMLGFVMMGIFSAMAQLGPIVVETNHYNVAIFRYLHIFLVTGLVLMLYGFLQNPLFLFLGGILVFVAMLIYAIEFLLTLKNSRRKTSITKAMKISNFFLLLGIFTGLVMAAAFNGFIALNPHAILNIHTFGLVVGFVILLIMGISIILIPMFGSAKRISDNEFSKSFIAIALGAMTMMFSAFFYTTLLQNISYGITILAILLYFYQLYKMTKSRKRVTHDIWAKSMYVSFSSFFISFLFLVSYLYFENEILLRTGMWLMFVGFFGFVIIGNFYKIVPFLVWFHIYSPLIETQPVPMLHELLNKNLSFLQWVYSLLGLLLSTIGLLTQDIMLFHGGAVLLLVGGFLFFTCIKQILNTDK